MKIIFCLVLTLASTITLMSHASKAERCIEKAALINSPSGLSVSLIAQKHRYKRNDQLKFDVMLTNSGKNAVYVFGELNWGISSSLMLRVRDASGKEIQPVGPFDDLTLASPTDKSAFVKLLPYHFLGTSFSSPLDVLNLNKPGKFEIFVEYHSPFAATDVPLSPFWGKENGTLRSNVVELEVVR